MSEFSLTKAGETALAFDRIMETLEKAKRPLADEEAHCIGIIEKLFQAFQGLCQWIEARRVGDSNSSRHLESAKTNAVLAAEALGSTRFSAFRETATDAASAIAAVSEIGVVLSIAKLIAQIPVPPFLIVTTNPYGSVEAKEKKQDYNQSDEPMVVRVMLTLDNRPWANPQSLQAGTVYDTTLTAIVPHWPEGADRLKFDFITTLPPERYRISPFELKKPVPCKPGEFELQGHVEFPVPQSFFSDPALLQMRAIFVSTKDPSFNRSATVIGYHKLRVRASDPNRTPLISKYRALDTRIVEIVEQVRCAPGVAEQHLFDFVEALSAVTNYMGICAQQALYRATDKIDEADFQKHLLIHMRTLLGEEVSEAPRQGGGITDIQYRSVTTELKVERAVSDREKMLRDYEKQPTQYSSAVGSQIGILCVLDLTEKDTPPAAPQNNIQLLAPDLHGFAAGKAPFPARIVAVVIDGNLRKPSSYSR